MSARCESCGQFRGEDHDCEGRGDRICELEGCSTELEPHQNHYCSRDHYGRFQKGLTADDPRPTCALGGCDTELELRQSKYCSRDHCLEDMRADKEKECERDGCETTHTNDRYCCYDCHYEDKRGEAVVEREEKECDRAGCTEPHTNERFCSTECANESRRSGPSTEIEEDLLDYSVVRDPDTGKPRKYHFVVNGKIYPVPAETWERICELYSDEGAGLTQKEVAREVGISHPVLKRMLRSAGQYKASLPFSRERIEREDEETLVEEAIETKERQIIQKMQSRSRRKMERELKKLKREEYQRRQQARAAAKIADSIDVPEPKLVDLSDGTGETFEAHVPTTDEHVGKLVRGKETFGEDYDTEIATRRIRWHGDHAAERIARWAGRCTVAHRSFLGDILHAILGETEHDTALDQDTRSFRVWQHTIEAAVYGITSLLQVADRVVVRGVRGNHEGFLFYIFLDSLRRTFEGHERVHVDLTPHRYDAFRIGDSLHVLDHGYGLNKLTTASNQVKLDTVAREVGGDDFHGARWIYTWLGDKHEYQTALVGRHHELIRLDSQGESDDYETSLRYASRPISYVYRVREDGRIEDSARLYFEEVGAA